MTRKFLGTVLSITVVLGIVSCSSEISEVRDNEIGITASRTEESTESSASTNVVEISVEPSAGSTETVATESEMSASVNADAAEDTRPARSTTTSTAVETEVSQTSVEVSSEEPISSSEDTTIPSEPISSTVTPTPQPTEVPAPTSPPSPTPTLAPVYDPQYTNCIADVGWNDNQTGLSGTVYGVPCRRNAAGIWVPTNEGDDMIADAVIASGAGGWGDWIIEGSERDFS